MAAWLTVLCCWLQHKPHPAVLPIYWSVSNNFVLCKASWTSTTLWRNALTNSSTTCRRFVHSTKTSVCTSRRQSESLQLAPLSAHPLAVDGWIKSLLVVSHPVRILRVTATRRCSATVTVPKQMATLINVGRLVILLLYSDWFVRQNFELVVTEVGWLVCFSGMFPYLMNDRFFLVPRHSQERCAVCKIPKACHPHTECDPALVR